MNLGSYILGLLTLPALLALILLAGAARWVAREAWLLHLVRKHRREKEEKEARERAEDEAWCKRLLDHLAAVERWREKVGNQIAEEIYKEWEKEDKRGTQD